MTAARFGSPVARRAWAWQEAALANHHFAALAALAAGWVRPIPAWRYPSLPLR